MICGVIGFVDQGNYGDRGYLSVMKDTEQLTGPINPSSSMTFKSTVYNGFK